MSKKLAIAGHSTRGNEVIELLEMLGGDNIYRHWKGRQENTLYFINEQGNIDNGRLTSNRINCEVFTLEEFLEKYPFKVGDKAVYIDDNDIVVISEIMWDDTVEDIFYNVKRIDEEDCFLCPPEVLKPYKETNMNKKLAIRGHSTRGKEVIELLEMLGGKNNCDCPGDNLGLCYLIDDEFDICAHYFGYDDYEDGELNIFTLEEFLEKYPFKVGDKVFLYDNITEGCVTGMKWEENTVKYCVYTSSECWCDVKELLKWNAIDLVEKHYGEQCEEMTKDITLKHLYELGMENIKDKFRKDFCEQCGSQRCSGQADELVYCERFKNLIKEEMKSKREYDELRMPLDDDDKLATEATIMGKKIFPPDGYLVGKITQTDNGMLVEYVEKKPVYPKTYKECCDVLLIPPYYNLRYHTYEHCYNEYATSNTLLSLENKLNTLGKLIICRDAYWKIAGEEMGLGKPWEPKYISLEDNTYFTIQTFNGGIDKSATSHRNAILAFPTIEMRDAFYENFKDLIETCKELL